MKRHFLFHLSTRLAVGYAATLLIVSPIGVAAQTTTVEKCTEEGAVRDKPVTIETAAEKDDCNSPAYNTAAKKAVCEKLNAEIDAAKAKPEVSQGTTRQVCKKGIWTSLVPSPQAMSNLLCFTQDECALPEYGGSVDRFVPDATCPAKTGKCLAPEPELALSSPVLGQSTVRGLRNYLFLMFNYAMSIVVIAAAIMFVYGGFRYIFGSTAGDFSAAKEQMVNATIGLVLALGSVMLLRTVNPATLTLDAVKVFLLKRVEFSLINRCDLFKPKDGKEVKFSDAGDPPGSIVFDSDSARFTVSGADTQCGKSYYIPGTPGQTCSGFACKGENAKRICASCAGLENKAGLCSGKKMACLNIPFGGTIGWTNSTYPISVFLIPVCSHALPGDSGPSNIADKMPSTFFVGSILNQNKADIGTSAYTIRVGSNVLDTMRNDCAKYGGPNGVVLGVMYHDNCGLGSAAATGFESVNTLQGIAKGAECFGSPDDFLIVTKQDCRGAYFQNESYQPFFSGYAMQPRKTVFSALKYVSPPVLLTSLALSATDNDKKLASTAMWCGWVNKPTIGSQEGTVSSILHDVPKEKVDKVKKIGRSRFIWSSNPQQNPYWSYDEIEKAVKGDNPISCDFDLTPRTAPRDPNMILMGGCGVTWNAIKLESGNPFPDKSKLPPFTFSDVLKYWGTDAWR